MVDEPRHQVNLLDFFAFLLRWRRFILAATLTVSVFIAILSFVLPPRYESAAAVRGVESSGQSLPALIASKLGSLGGLANIASNFGEVPEEMLIAILKSRWMSERVIAHFDLRTVYKMKDARPEDLIDALASRTFFDLDELSSVVTVRVQDRSPLRAKEMAEYLVDELDRRNQELKSSAARKEREFVEHRLLDERSKLAMLEDSLFRFQIETGVLDIGEQTKATLQAAAALQAQRLLTISELELQRQIYGGLGAETEFAKLKLAGIDSSLQTLIRPAVGGQNDVLLNLGEVPKNGLTYARLYRDIEIEQILVGFLLQQYEQARIEESRNTPTLVRLDPPREATKKAWPRRGMMVMIAFVATFVFATIIALGLDLYRRAMNDTTHPQHVHLKKLIGSWTRSK